MLLRHLQVRGKVILLRKERARVVAGGLHERERALTRLKQPAARKESLNTQRGAVRAAVAVPLSTFCA